MRLNHRILCILALSLAACRSDSNESADGPTGSGADAPVSAGTTIKQLLANLPAFKTPVTVSGVVVVAHQTSSSSGHIWVQDPGGGANSGIHVFCSFTSTSTPCTLKSDDIDALKIGEVVDVSGKYDNNNFQGHPDDQEIIQPVITKQNKMMAPVALTVDAAKLAKMADTMGADVKSLNNALVKINEPLAVASMMASEYAETLCSPPHPDAGPGTPDAGPKADAGPKVDGGTPATTYYDFGFEAMTQTSHQVIAISTFNNDTFNQCLPDCGYCADGDMIKQSDTFKSVQGIAYANKAQDGTLYVEIRPVNDADLPKN